jgi:hypothetical protein
MAYLKKGRMYIGKFGAQQNLFSQHSTVAKLGLFSSFSYESVEPNANVGNVIAET